MREHCRKSDELLAHYFQTYCDRAVYWTARERARTCGDILVLIIDSYDKAKVTLPRWPFQRTPKKPIYEATRRDSFEYYSSFFMFLTVAALERFTFNFRHNTSEFASHQQGTSMVLTGCIVHGFGVFLYLVDEGMAQGASWTIEVETHLQPNLHTCSFPPIISMCCPPSAPRQCDLSTRPLRWRKKRIAVSQPSSLLANNCFDLFPVTCSAFFTNSRLETAWNWISSSGRANPTKNSANKFRNWLSIPNF